MCVTVTLLSRKLQLTYTLHITLCLLGYFIEPESNFFSHMLIDRKTS